MARRGENIRKRKDGRWEGRYICRKADGTRSGVRSVYARSYREVRQKLAAAKQDAAQPADKEETSGKGILFTDAAEKWLEYILDTRKYSTFIKYRQVYEKYLRDLLGGQETWELTQEKMETEILPKAREYAGMENLSQSLEKSIYGVAGQVLAYASKKYRIPCPTLKAEEQNRSLKKAVRIFDQAEQKKLQACLAADMDLYKLGVQLCLYTGLRLGELCALKWADIDMENRMIRVSSTVQRLPIQDRPPEGRKTALIESDPKSFCSRREIPINDSLYHLLSAHSHDRAYLVGRDKAADPRTYQKKFASYLKEAGIAYRSFHTLRHTFATNCAACGADAKAISELLGHSGVQITLNRYVHPSMHSKRNCLNLLSGDLSGQKMGHVV